MSFLNATVADRVRTILAAAPALTGVTVFAGVLEPGPEAPLESILVDHEPTTWSFPSMRAGTRSFESFIGLRIQIETHREGETATATQARWFAIASAVMDALRADPTLQSTGAIPGLLGVVGEGEIRSLTTGQLADNTGWACIGDVIVRARTRIC